MKHSMTWSRVTIAVLVSATFLLATISNHAAASPVECDSSQCTVNLSPSLQIIAGAGMIDESVIPGRIEIFGDVVLSSPAMDLPLSSAQLVMQRNPYSGELLEFYGMAALPLDEWELLENLQLDAEPPMAVIGLFQQNTLNELFNNTIPLNDGAAIDGSKRESVQPYLVFHASSGGLSLDINKMFKLGMGDNSSFSLAIAEEKTVSFALDISDPYLFIGQDFKMSFKNKDGSNQIEPDKTYLAVRTETTDEFGDVSGETIEYYDDNGALVHKFIHDTQTGALIKQDIASDGRVTVNFYQRDAQGDFTREGDDKANGDYFNLFELNEGADVNNRNRSRINGYSTSSYDEKNPDGTVSREIIEHKDSQGNVVYKFIYDPATDKMTKQDFSDDGKLVVSFYEGDGSGDYVLAGADKNDGEYFSRTEIEKGTDVSDNNRPRDTDKPANSDSNSDSNNNKRRKFDLGVDAFGFSKNGWIPYVAENTYGVPHDSREFSGQLYLKGAITMDGFLVLDGEVVTYIGDQGFIMGGNGDLALTIPGLPDAVDFSLYLGGASSTFQATLDKQMAFISGIMAPDTGLFKELLPISPEGQVLAAGYIDSELVDTEISLDGSFTLGAEKLGELIGVELNNLQSVQGRASLGMQGFSLHGVTTSQIHPDIKFGGTITVDLDISFIDPQDFRLKLAGAADVFGVGLEEVSIEISKNGMYLNGVFVTPLTEIAMLGSITNRGPALTGYATLSLGLGEITKAMQDATKTLTAAQAEVRRLDGEINRLRTEVVERRAEHQRKLQNAQNAITTAQNEVNRLNAAVSKEYSGINYQKSRISKKYKWYKKAKWYQKAGRWASYKAEKAWRSAVIAKHYVAIGVLKGTIAVAKLALEGTKLALKGLEALTEVAPVDLDPKVAAVIVAKGVAVGALEIAKLPFKYVPIIDYDFEGQIEAKLDITGIHGSITAEFDGFEALKGTLEFDPVPNACINIPTFGNACTKF